MSSASRADRFLEFDDGYRVAPAPCYCSWFEGDAARGAVKYTQNILSLQLVSRIPSRRLAAWPWMGKVLSVAFDPSRMFEVTNTAIGADGADNDVVSDDDESDGKYVYVPCFYEWPVPAPPKKLGDSKGGKNSPWARVWLPECIVDRGSPPSGCRLLREIDGGKYVQAVFYLQSTLSLDAPDGNKGKSKKAPDEGVRMTWTIVDAMLDRMITPDLVVSDVRELRHCNWTNSMKWITVVSKRLSTMHCAKLKSTRVPQNCGETMCIINCNSELRTLANSLLLQMGTDVEVPDPIILNRLLECAVAAAGSHHFPKVAQPGRLVKQLDNIVTCLKKFMLFSNRTCTCGRCVFESFESYTIGCALVSSVYPPGTLSELPTKITYDRGTHMWNHPTFDDGLAAIRWSCLMGPEFNHEDARCMFSDSLEKVRKIARLVEDTKELGDGNVERSVDFVCTLTRILIVCTRDTLATFARVYPRFMSLTLPDVKAGATASPKGGAATTTTSTATTAASTTTDTTTTAAAAVATTTTTTATPPKHAAHHTTTAATPASHAPATVAHVDAKSGSGSSHGKHVSETNGSTPTTKTGPHVPSSAAASKATSTGPSKIDAPARKQTPATASTPDTSSPPLAKAPVSSDITSTAAAAADESTSYTTTTTNAAGITTTTTYRDTVITVDSQSIPDLEGDTAALLINELATPHCKYVNNVTTQQVASYTLKEPAAGVEDISDPLRLQIMRRQTYFLLKCRDILLDFMQQMEDGTAHFTALATQEAVSEKAYEAQRARLEERFHELWESVETNEQRLGELETLAKELDERKAELSALNYDMTELNNRLKTVAGERDRLKAEVDGLRATVQEYRTSLSKAEASRKELESKHAELTKKLNTAKANAARAPSLDKELTSALEAVKAGKTRLSVAEEKLKTLHNEENTLLEEISHTAVEDLAPMQARAVQAETEVQALLDKEKRLLEQLRVRKAAGVERKEKAEKGTAALREQRAAVHKLVAEAQSAYDDRLAAFMKLAALRDDGLSRAAGGVVRAGVGLNGSEHTSTTVNLPGDMLQSAPLYARHAQSSLPAATSASSAASNDSFPTAGLLLGSLGRNLGVEI